MKKILIYLLVMISLSSVAQTELEKSILDEINSYRISHKLTTPSWDQIAYKAAKYHTEWMSKARVVSHYETVDVPNFVEILDPLERGQKFGLRVNTTPIELCNTARVSGRNPFLVPRASNKEIAKNIIDGFKSSPEHNEALLLEMNAESKFGVGISSVIIDDVVYTTVYFIEELD
jgi:uncharacterized protein YkwD